MNLTEYQRDWGVQNPPDWHDFQPYKPVSDGFGVIQSILWTLACFIVTGMVILYQVPL